MLSRISSFFDLWGNEIKPTPQKRLPVAVKSKTSQTGGTSWLHPTYLLPLINMIDMFAVSLVVPLLFQYYKLAGIERASTREFMASIFSISQIVGGLAMGMLTDLHLLERRSVLLLSFGGSAMSYALLVFGGTSSLIFSRILVGLVKQTMTITTTMMTKCTKKHERSTHMGRLNASTTIAWVVGPAVGGTLFRFVSVKAPAILACFLFILNLLVAILYIPTHYEEKYHEDDDEEEDEEADCQKQINPQNQPRSSIMSTLSKCFASKTLGLVVGAQLVLTWIMKATNYTQLGSFYESNYGIKPHQRGYVSSYQQLLMFIVQASLVKPFLNIMGGERRATCVLAAVVSFTVFLESLQNLWLFLTVLCPIIALAFSILNLSLKTMLTHEAPKNSISSVLASVDVLQNVVSVSVPFYRTFLFQLMPSDAHESAIMKGDPDPASWLYSSAMHWIIATFCLSYLLLRDETLWNEPKRKGK